MAQFTGTGQLRLNGNDSRFYDFTVHNTGGLRLGSSGQRVENCQINRPLVLATSAQRCVITNNLFAGPVPAITLPGNNHQTVISDNTFNNGTD